MLGKNKVATICLLLACATAFGGAAAERLLGQQGPLPPSPKREVIVIPADPKPEAPPFPPAEMIQRIVKQEDELIRARAGYTFRKTVRVQELGDDGKPAGEFVVITEPALAPDGKRYEKIVEEPPSTLRGLPLQPEDMEILARIPQFPLTSEQLSKYELTYTGKLPLDELTTYLFQVKPRQIERAHAYFEGLIWVEDRDFTIVKTYGRWITETGPVSSPQLPFTMFETYRENVAGKLWFPSYLRSEDALKLKKGEVRIRLTVRWEGYKPLER